MVVLIDFSNLVWSSFFGSLKFFKYEPETCPSHFTGHVDYFHQKLVKILQAQPCNEYIFVLDRKPYKKMKIYPEYKKARKQLEFNPKVAIFDLLDAWKAKVLFSEGNEADDTIASYVANNLDTPITVATTDKDLWQLLENPATKIYNFHKGSFVTKRELSEAYDLIEYSQVKLHKTLWGDSGDGVPNLAPRMQKNLMPYVLQTDGTLTSFWNVINPSWDKLSDRCKEILIENREKLKINYALVRLNFDCPYTLKCYEKPILKEQEEAQQKLDSFLSGEVTEGESNG